MAAKETISADPSEEAPLDPAVERVRAKLVRLMMLSIGTLLVGVLAVFGAVIYRASGDGASGEVATGATSLQLAPGATVRSAVPGLDGIVVLIDLADGGSELVVIDAATARPRLRVTFTTTRTADG